MSSKLRAAFRLLLLACWMVGFGCVLAVSLLFRNPWHMKLVTLWYRGGLKIAHLRITESFHEQARRFHDKPTLYVANHSSYLDILILGAVLPVSFVAKQEIKTWPIFGQLAPLGKTHFYQP